MRLLSICAAAFLTACAFVPDTARAADRIWKVMPIGDSITEGGATFSNWRYPLWEKLTAAGYFIDYVGSRSAAARIGTLKHEGYSGQNVEYIAEQLETTFPQNPADIVLLHAGHNYYADTDPVPRMLTATESIIATCRATNPQVTILLAQVITSLKLPKYSYIPAFNAALPALATRLSTPTSRVIIVDQATGFDPAADTVADEVHPSASGAAKMRDRWFEALVSLLPTPEEASTLPQLLPYKTPAGSAPLNLHLFAPPTGPTSLRPAIVFFFAGGWANGTPLQFYPECRHFAAQGYVAISADYRISSTHSGATAFKSVEDAKSAIRYLRSHANELGIDPDRIIAAGASAGGHLAAATALLPGLNDPTDDLSVSARPDALLLWYPVIDNGPGGFSYSSFGSNYRQISPIHNIGLNPPPSLTLLGTNDEFIPVATGQEFQRRLQNFGGRADLILYPGGIHPLYAYRDPSATTKAFRATILNEASNFLKSLTLVSPRPLFGRVGVTVPAWKLRDFNSIIHPNWSLTSGRLPAGVSLATDGSLTGTPSEAGEFPLTLTANASSMTTAHALTLYIAGSEEIQALANSPGIVFQNTSYQQALAVRGAAGPVQWALDPVTPLPTGIFLSNDGTLSGSTAAAVGNYPVTFHVTDSSERNLSLTLTLTVSAGLEHILDVGSSGVVLSGSWTSSTFLPGYYGSSYHHDGNTSKGSKSVTYTFTGIAPGTWSVSATWIPGSGRASNVPYRVETSASNVTYTADQVTGTGWNPLGIVNVPADGIVRVIISNQSTNGFVIADAVRLSKSQDTPADRYARWATSLPTTDRSPTADPMSQGWPNLLSFYAGRTPLSHEFSPPLIRILPDGSLRAFFNRAMPEFPAVVEGSADLLQWQPVATSADMLSTFPAIDGDYAVAVADPTLRFFRYQVSQPASGD